MSKSNLSFRIDPELADEIKELAACERRRPGQLVAILVADALAARRASEGQPPPQRSAA